MLMSTFSRGAWRKFFTMLKTKSKIQINQNKQTNDSKTLQIAAGAAAAAATTTVFHLLECGTLKSMHTCALNRIYTRTPKHLYTRARARPRAHSQTHTHTHARARTHTHTHTYTHTHTHTHTHVKCGEITSLLRCPVSWGLIPCTFRHFHFQHFLSLPCRLFTFFYAQPPWVLKRCACQRHAARARH